MRATIVLLTLLACATSDRVTDSPKPGVPKRPRTAAEKKIDTHLLDAIEHRSRDLVQFDEEGRALVTIRATVTAPLLDAIRKGGGAIESSSEQYHDIRAHIALERLKPLAAWKEVVAILPLETAQTNGHE